MHPVHFEGSVEIGKPADMTDEQCYSVWAKFGFGKLYEILQLKKNGLSVEIPEVYVGTDSNNFPYYLTAWQPNKEDIDAINAGLPVYIKTLTKGLPPMVVFTIDQNGNPNFED